MVLAQCPQCSLNTYDLVYLNDNYLHLDVANIIIERQSLTEDWNADQQAEINRALGRIDVLESRRIDFGRYVDETFRQIGLDVGALRTTANIQSELILALQEFVHFGDAPDIPNVVIPPANTQQPPATGACDPLDFGCHFNKFFSQLGIFGLGAGAGGIVVLLILAVILLRR